MGLRALQRRRRELSADAPREEGAQRCFERRWRRGAGAASTPCLGRTAPWIAPNRESPRAWAWAPCSGGGTSPQPTLPASIFRKLSLRQFLFRANDVEIYNNSIIYDLPTFGQRQTRSRSRVAANGRAGRPARGRPARTPRRGRGRPAAAPAPAGASDCTSLASVSESRPLCLGARGGLVKRASALTPPQPQNGRKTGPQRRPTPGRAAIPGRCGYSISGSEGSSRRLSR